jgi:hypothetical protein
MDRAGTREGRSRPRAPAKTARLGWHIRTQSVPATTHTKMDESVLVRTFEMLIERLGRLEDAAADTAKTMSALAEAERTRCNT